LSRSRQRTSRADVERVAGCGANFCDLLAHLLLVEHRDRQRSEPAGLRNFDDELCIHRAGHRRQHDRMFNPEELRQTAIRPHRVLLSGTLKPRNEAILRTPGCGPFGSCEGSFRAVRRLLN
jgi:hypothetical protein